MVDRQLQLAEVRPPKDVGDGLAPRPAADQLPESPCLARLQALVGLLVELGAVPADRVGQQQLGVEPGGVAAGGCQ